MLVKPAPQLTLENLPLVRIWTPADVRPAAESFGATIGRSLGLRVGASHNIASGRPMVDADGNVLATDVFGWADEPGESWWRTPQFAFESPLPTACRYESEPFWCNADGFRASRPNSFLNDVDLKDFERRALTRVAMVAPVHLPFGQIGAVSAVPLDRSCSELEREFTEFGAIFGLFARTFIAGYVAVMTQARRMPSQPSLNKREVECLRLAGIGKSDNDIATLLSLSRSTVRFHITNAMTKLDAVNRAQSLLKAAQLGYIRLP